ncbi:ComEC/Rec2 family competence protein [Nocardia asteroides]|uniref:ComEC/Rec2 family competence protein n=1 Tax=Nocardia asteroides TaxID=1824 RepID=UPI0034493348
MTGTAGEELATPTGERQVLDLRLVPAAFGCWMATIFALSLGWFAGVLLAVGAVVVAIALWVVWLWAVAHERERWRVVAVAGLAAMLLAAGFGAAGAWRAHHVEAHPLRESFGRTVSVLAVVTDDPKLMRAGGFGGQRPWIVHAALREFGSGPGSTRVGGSLVIIAQGAEWSALSPGQAVRFRGKVSEPTRSDLTVAALHPVAAPELVGIPPWWQRLATGVRADLSEAAARALSPAAAGLLPALVVGDTAALSDEVRDNFEIAGLQHLCVVSGANFTILLTALLALTRLLTLGPRSSAIAAAGTVVVFVVLARPDPSVLRAAAMGSVTVLALLTGRRKQALPALGAAVIGLLGVAPYLAVSAGFALSVLATAGLILLAPSWADWLRARGWWRAPAEIVAVAAAAFVVTLPLMVALSGRVSLVAILANALVAPVVGVITVIGAMGAALAWLWGDAAVAVLWCARPPLWWLLSVADRLAAVPGATMAVPAGTLGGLVAAAIMVLLVAALRWSKTRRLLAVCALGVSTVLIPMRLWHPGWPPDGWAVAMCDVGQGDGLALAVSPGAAVVIDTGPDPRAIRRCLDRLDITHVPLLVLTHPHADHIGGLAGALRGRTITAIATAPGELDPSSACPTAPRSADEPGEQQKSTRSRTGTTPARPAPSADAPPGDIAAEHSAPPAAVRPDDAVPVRPISATVARLEGAVPVYSAPAAVARPRGAVLVHSAPAALARLESAVRARSELPTDAWPGSPVSRCADGATAPTDRERWNIDPEHGAARGESSGRGGMAKVAELSKAAGVPSLELSAGQVLTFGAVELTVLAPEGDQGSALDADEANDRSVVLRARTAVGTVLLTGDIEAAAQARVLRGGEVGADILKVPHHGSRTTTPEFLGAVRPRLALISSGADNTFGHPHPSITTALAALGTTVVRTDRDGDVVVFGTAAEPRVMTARRRGSRGGKSAEPHGDDRAPPTCRRPNVGSPGERTPCRGTSGSR